MVCYNISVIRPDMEIVDSIFISPIATPMPPPPVSSTLLMPHAAIAINHKPCQCVALQPSPSPPSPRGISMTLNSSSAITWSSDPGV